MYPINSGNILGFFAIASDKANPFPYFLSANSFQASLATKTRRMSSEKVLSIHQQNALHSSEKEENCLKKIMKSFDFKEVRKCDILI